MMRVVIIEDEEMIRWGLVHTLDWLGMGCVVVGEAEDGEKGLELITAKSPQIVLTDIKMPGMNGLEMIQEAQKNHRFKSIILTSYQDFTLAKRAIDLRASEYLLKPVDEDELKNIVERIALEIDQEQLQLRLTSCPAVMQVDSSIQKWSKLMDYVSTDKLAESTLAIIMERYSEKLTVEQVAAENFVSSSYLSRRLKANLSHTFLELLNMYRVQQATRLMIQDGGFLYEISARTGFSDYKHFCNVFKRCMGITPREFMREWKSCQKHA